MSLSDNGFWEFGECRFDCLSGTLLRDGAQVPLRPRAVAVLKYLVLNRDRTVQRKELVGACWPGAFVSDTVVDYQISTLRAALGDSARDVRYIENRYGQGWRFIAEVREVSPPEPENPEKTRRWNLKSRFLIAGAVSACAALLMTAVIMSGRTDSVEVLRVTERTNDGRPKGRPLLSDGTRLYCTEFWDGYRGVGSIPVGGGKPVRVPVPAGSDLQDASAHRQHLLLLRPDKQNSGCAVEFSPKDNSTEELVCGITAAAYRGADELSFVRDGALFSAKLNRHGPAVKLRELGNAHQLRWSPDGRIVRYALDAPNREVGFPFRPARRLER